MLSNEHVYCVVVAFKMTEQSNESVPNFALSLNILCGNYWGDSEGHSYGQLVIGSFIVKTCPLMHKVSCIEFFGKTSNHPDDSAPLQPRFGTQ